MHYTNSNISKQETYANKEQKSPLHSVKSSEKQTVQHIFAKPEISWKIATETIHIGNFRNPTKKLRKQKGISETATF
jgi:hypothetical protein